MKKDLALFTFFLILNCTYFLCVNTLTIELHKQISLKKVTLKHSKRNLSQDESQNTANKKNDNKKNLKSVNYLSKLDHNNNNVSTTFLRTNYPDVSNPTLWKKGNCFVLINNNFYNLYAFRNKKLNILAEGGYIVDINLCKDLMADNGKRSMIINKSKGIRFSDRFIFDKFWAVENNKIYLDLPQGDPCTYDESILYQTTVILKCNPTINTPIIRNSNSGKDAFSKDKCRNFIKIESKDACSVGQYIFWYDAFGFDQKILALVLIGAGLIFVFLGEKIASISSFVVIALSTGLIIKVLFGLFVKLELQICLTAGITLSVVTLLYSSLRYLLLSIVLGFFTGNILYNFLLQIISIDPYMIYWISIITCISLSILFSLMFEYGIVMITTAAVGAYSTVRGLSLYLGGFPEETYTGYLISHGEFNQIKELMDKRVVAYLTSMGCLFVFGLFIQGCLKSENIPVRRKSSLLEYN
jgi:hypothetical protein